MRNIWIALVLVACTPAPSKSVPPVSIEWNEAFELKYGQSIALPGDKGSIAFDSLLFDHRCPIDAQCLSQGQASVSMSIESGDDGRESFRLSVGDDPKLEHTFDGLIIRIQSIKPLPKSGIDPKAVDYSIILRVIEQ